ncbi:Neuropeptide FF receptor 2 [Trichoplax sp. H2]|nr:Neuropeptide FF receptor 2 [Trichoplax sp. H2]|eukprot:RDD37892.1 Neuropeptide FF receptor 2 [Trichoplax sp. H2]
MSTSSFDLWTAALPEINHTINSSENNKYAFNRFKLIRIVLPFIIFPSIFVIIANCMICYAIIKKKELHTSTYYLMINRAISDCMIVIWSSAIIILHYYLALTNTSTSFLAITCKIAMFSDVAAFTASTFTLAAISIERYHTVLPSKPLKTSFFNTPLKLRMMAGFSWIAGISMAWPLIILTNVDPKNAWICNVAYFGPSFNITYVMILFCISFLLPAILIAISYFKIIQFLYRKNIVHSDQQYSRILAFRHNRQRHLNTIKMLILVTLGFMSTCLPIFLAYIAVSFSRRSLTDYLIQFNQNETSLVQLGLIFIIISCLLNPIIYLYYNYTIRTTVFTSCYPTHCSCIITKPRGAIKHSAVPKLTITRVLGSYDS